MWEIAPLRMSVFIGATLDETFKTDQRGASKLSDVDYVLKASKEALQMADTRETKTKYLKS